MLQAGKLLDASLNVRAMRLVFFIQVAELGLELGAESTQAARPAMVPTDDGGIHQKFFPADGDGKRGFVGRIGRRGSVGCRWCAGKIGEDFVVGWHPLQDGLNGRAVLIDGRELSEGQILCEARSGAAIRGASEQREESASSGIGPGRASAEIAWDGGAPQSFFE